jgi:hypothetical protein
MTQVVECLPSKLEALNSVSSTAKKWGGGRMVVVAEGDGCEGYQKVIRFQL